MSRASAVVVNSTASVDEVAAIVAAVTAVLHDQACVQATSGEPARAATPQWVRAARHDSRRVAATRGPWRLSGRIPRH